MADIRLITIVPSQPIANVQQPQVTQGNQTPTLLGSLSVGAVLTGFIVNRDANGNPVLRTESGDVTFQSNFFLKIGSEVSIRIQNAAGNTLAHILTVNGQPPEVAANQSAFAQEPDVILNSSLGNDAPASAATSARAPQAASTISTSPLQSIVATLLSEAPATTQQPNPAPAGTQLALKLLTLNYGNAETKPAATPTGQAYLQPSANPSLYAAYSRVAGAPAAPASTPKTPQATTSPLASRPPYNPDAELAPVTFANPSATPEPKTVPSVAATPLPTSPTGPNEVPQEAVPATVPAVQNASPNVIAQGSVPSVVPTPVSESVFLAPTHIAPQQGQVIEATVIGHEPSGEVLVQSPLGVLRLQAGTDLAPGSTVTFEVTEIAPPAPQTAAAATTAPAPLTDLAQQWDTLQQIVTLLTSRDALDGIDFSSPALPWVASDHAASQANPATPQTSFASGLLVFISALRGGDFKNWLGRANTQWLEDHGHGELVDKASAEFGSLSRQFVNPPPGHWQTLFFPIAVDGEMQQVRMFTKRERKQGENKRTKDEEDTRFVVEMNLSQLGEMQIDGFIRRRPEELQFDLVMRSQKELPKDVQNDILQIYQSTGELTGYKGSISFQAVKQFPVNPMEEIAAQSLGNMMA